ncbi:integrase [Mycobacterium bourgelatii]|uniref:Integrase n=1 Tax=Mycobacterium bourgelatii TaxID=1273442 RepID=A0A7I9YWL3_MYCBU|nr:integrase [Mycobacterium bourgelatii]MCV6978293.1 integrase [Mycobacterium bourgelatii]GFG93045.1 hypothetical protein MBOU_50870 [Mycobacterium bourgelatii]
MPRRITIIVVAATALASTPVTTAVASATASQSISPATHFYPADPAPDAGDQSTAEQRVVEGYVNKQADCTPDLPANPQSVTWDPPGFAPNVGGTGNINDADPRLGGRFVADYVNGHWNIAYPYC